MGGISFIPTPAQIGAVPTSRQVIAGTNMTGGGALTANVTLNSTGGGGGVIGYKGITKLIKTSTQNINTGAWRDVTWDVSVFDNLNAVNLGASNINIIVPSGVNFAKAELRLNWDNAVSATYVIVGNGTSGSPTVSLCNDIRASQNESLSSICGGFIAVTPGDTFKLYVNGGIIDRVLGGNFGSNPLYPNLTIYWLANFSDLI